MTKVFTQVKLNFMTVIKLILTLVLAVVYLFLMVI